MRILGLSVSCPLPPLQGITRYRMERPQHHSAKENSSQGLLVIGLGRGPFEICIMIITAVAIYMKNMREIVGVWHKGFSHQTMHLEVLSLDAHTTIALTVERCYLVPRIHWEVRIPCTQHPTITCHVI